MKYFITIFALVFCATSYGQVTGYHDSINCATTSTTLHAMVVGDIPTSTGIVSDDGYSGIIPIGFTFNFYGTPYTNLLIGSNGNICFTTGLAGGFDPWPISSALLGNTSVLNCICGPWCDIYIPAGGTITYSLSGAAPNRRFTASFCHCAMFYPSTCPGEWITTQIILYETTNVTEVHIGHKTICLAWNSGRAICGVQNAAGTDATVAPSRDWTPPWLATDEGWRFSPIGGPSYSVTSIPYAPIPYASSTIYWYDSTTGAYLGSGPTLTVAPVIGTTYKAGALGCDDTSFAYIHVIALPGLVAGTGDIPRIDNETHTDPTICGKCDGTVTLYGLKPHFIDSVIYSIGGVEQPPIVDSAGLDSTIHVGGLCAGYYDYFYVKVGNCPSNHVGPILLAPPPMHINLDYTVDLGCAGDNVTFYDHSVPFGVGYTDAWDFGDTTATSASSNPTHTYMNQGTHTVHFTYGTTYGCSIDTTFDIQHVHPIYDSFASQWNAICVGTNIQYTNYSTSGTNNDNTSSLLTYMWDFGTGAKDSVLNPSYEFDIPGRYKVKLTITDTIGCSATFIDTVEVILINVRTQVGDTSVCLKDSLLLEAYPDVTPRDVMFTYGWTPANNIGIDSGLTTVNDVSEVTTRFMGVGNFDYTVTVTTPPMPSNPIGCQASATEKIESYPPVTFTNLTSSPQVIPYGSSVQLNADGAVYYRWTPNNGTLSNNNINNPVATPKDTNTVYTVYGMNLFGCLDSANISIAVDFGMTEAIPSAFTPNGDGLNDVFRINRLKFQKLVEFVVFNRWGQQVFRTIDPENGWDGTYHGAPQDVGTYNYAVIVGMPDGTNRTYKGTVTLIR